MAELKGFLLSVARFVLALAIVFVVLVFLGWFRSHTLIFFALLAMLWYFVRTGEWAHFRLRTLFVLMLGIAVILAIVTQIPCWALGGKPLLDLSRL